jgi:hypothetical protein
MFRIHLGWKKDPSAGSWEKEILARPVCPHEVSIRVKNIKQPARRIAKAQMSA